MFVREKEFIMAKVKMTLKKSLIGRSDKQIKTAHSLNLRKIGDASEHEDGAVLQGKLRVISHLIEVQK